MRFERSWRLGAAIVPALLMMLAYSGCARSPEQKSARFLDAGKKLLDRKDPTRAVLQFRNAIQATPGNAEAYYQLSRAYLASGDVRSGIASLRKALALNPQHKDAQLRLSQLMAATDDSALLKDAQQRLKVLLQETPDNPDALHALALTELKLGAPDDAMSHLAQATAVAPEELLIAVTTAQAKLQQRDPKGAEEALKAIVGKTPKSSDAHLALGDFYVSQKRLAEAEAQVKLALDIDPKSGPALMTLARLQYTAGRKQEAEENFKRLAGFAGYESIHAIFLFQEGRRDDGIRELEALTKARPDDRQVRTLLVVAYQAANRTNDAKSLLNAVLKKNPKDLDALLQRGELSMASGDYAQAEADLGQVSKAKPDSPEVHYIVGKLDRAQGKNLIYREELARALKLNPFLLQVRLEAAQDFISSNKPKAALDLLDEAPEVQRNSIALLVERNWALWALGDMPGMRKGIDLGLARERSSDLLAQDGLWKLRARQPAAARSSLEEALKINGGDVMALAALRQTYSAQESPAALQKIKEYAGQQPKSAPVQEFLGLALVANGDRAGGRKAFDAARTADPQFTRAELSLVQMDAMDGKLDEGRARLRALLSSGKNDPTARLWLGNLEEVKGNHDAALEQFRKVVEVDPQNAQALNNLAYLLAEYSKKPDEALPFAEKAVELAPDNSSYADTLGWVLYQRGLYVPALKYLEQSANAKGRPGAVPGYHLAMAYAKAGYTARSKAALEAALKLDPNPGRPEAKAAQELVLKSN